jgi:hypothetical protein
VTGYGNRGLQRIADIAAARYRATTARRKCFVSYHQADEDEVAAFLDAYGEIFIAKCIGITADDPLINSTDRGYIMRKIRENYLTDSTVTIVLIGRCTWAREYVDWEIASTLRNDPKNGRSGLMGITLPAYSASASRKGPPRLQDNLPPKGGDGYARWWKYPESSAGLRSCIEDAFRARTRRASLVTNSRLLYSYNRTCT